MTSLTSALKNLLNLEEHCAHFPKILARFLLINAPALLNGPCERHFCSRAQVTRATDSSCASGADIRVRVARNEAFPYQPTSPNETFRRTARATPPRTAPFLATTPAPRQQPNAPLWRGWQGHRWQARTRRWSIRPHARTRTHARKHTSTH